MTHQNKPRKSVPAVPAYTPNPKHEPPPIFCSVPPAKLRYEAMSEDAKKAKAAGRIRLWAIVFLILAIVFVIFGRSVFGQVITTTSEGWTRSGTASDPVVISTWPGQARAGVGRGTSTTPVDPPPVDPPPILEVVPQVFVTSDGVVIMICKGTITDADKARLISAVKTLVLPAP